MSRTATCIDGRHALCSRDTGPWPCECLCHLPHRDQYPDAQLYRSSPVEWISDMDVGVDFVAVPIIIGARRLGAGERLPFMLRARMPFRVESGDPELVFEVRGPFLGIVREDRGAFLYAVTLVGGAVQALADGFEMFGGGNFRAMTVDLERANERADEALAVLEGIKR